METLVLAEGNIDWMELIILLIVFGGSALAAVSKKLIAYFSPPKEEGGLTGVQRQAGERPPTRPAGTPGTAPPPSRMPSPPRPPVARPAAPPQTVPGGRRPASPISIERSGKPARRPMAPVQTAQRQQSVVPQRTPRGRLRSAPDQDGELVEDAVSQTLLQLESQLAEIDERIMGGIEEELGQFESQLTATGESAAPTASGVRMPHLTQPALRRAIVLNEVLGPPVALRAARSVSIPGLL